VHPRAGLSVERGAPESSSFEENEMFKQKLERVVANVGGSLGCLLIGFDGIPIDSVFVEEDMPQMSAVAVELSNLLDKFKRLQAYDLGLVNEVSITASDITMLARVVADEYLLVLAMQAESDVNRGQTMLRLISPFVERDM
jgi:predicted regulator of Ras-like GTPase activity (Roadblock/LC7/MglB family)